MLSDEQLAKRCLAGDQEALEELLERYKGYVFAIIFNFVSDSAEAEDIAQEVFLQVYRSLPRCRFDNFKSWIGRIAVNKAIDHRRKAEHLSRIVPEEKAGESVLRTEQAPSPEELYLAKEDWQRVQHVAGELPEIYGRTLAKYYFEGKSCREIAVEEGISVKTVESRLSRARALFKKRWGREKG
ncbi:RNA polymerase sigma factor [Thermosediminibacter oceani]|uniref:RNA polymerase sigma factor n=1 Tax=Thermosediminibacter oceani (strain ATCC BAA-1034 / DSM 16646 / JW/IW-1228P) TaxID=555079 RepID=D9S150_THEOJ|nr:RNA polymerase sigma factor [Thermosediminibacter oceani]ADL08929.1 RNA polymerase, sigma-24 subunit, ECF subfamily [Thermosediminibacter oceani DSM 16646]